MPGLPGEAYALVPALLDPIGRTFCEGIASRTHVYSNEHGTWITGFAPIRGAGGGVRAVLDVDYRSRDEVGHLTRAVNEMLEGLRQRDFIRDTLGRYVSPEVARTLLELPEGLSLGGEKREVTILMSDLRGYTRFAEEGDPAVVMQVLNGYLARMTEIIIEHGAPSTSSSATRSSPSSVRRCPTRTTPSALPREPSPCSARWRK